MAKGTESLQTSRVEGYASALVAVAMAEDQLDRMPSELFAVAQAVTNNDSLRETLIDRSIPASRRIGVLEDLLANQASPVTLNVLSLLVGGGRGSEIPEIAEEVLAQVAALRGEAVAEVRSAVPLDEAQIQRLTVALTRASARTISVQVVIDPDVLGGITTQIGDTVYDGSVRTRLENMKERLA